MAETRYVEILLAMYEMKKWLFNLLINIKWNYSEIFDSNYITFAFSPRVIPNNFQSEENGLYALNESDWTKTVFIQELISSPFFFKEVDTYLTFQRVMTKIKDLMEKFGVWEKSILFENSKYSVKLDMRKGKYQRS